MRRRREAGFTLIELMIVVAIMGILATIALPKFADLLRKSREGQTKGNLATLRSAIRMYYADKEAIYPGDDLNALVPDYLDAIPSASANHYHGASNAVVPVNPLGGFGSSIDKNGWINQNSSFFFPTRYGDVMVNCFHTDSKNIGHLWW